MLNTNDVLQKRYRIVRPLGQGGMGAVYEAIDERFGEPIALKEINFELNDFAPSAQLEVMTRAFEREAKALAKARHEVVPYVRDYFFELDRQFLVMELVEGDDLALLLSKRAAPFPVSDVFSWLDQLLDALDYLHNLNPSIIHRDIKPQNLKLNSRRKIKLLDFGIAKSVDSGAFTVTNQTFVGATLNYSPIEQILRVINPTFREFILLKHKERTEKVLHQNTDARCDIYALGATFYHLLTNIPPVDVVKRTLDVWEGKGDPLPAPADLNPDVPAALSACLVKSLAIERDERHSSAVKMLADVHAAYAQFDNHSHRISRPHLQIDSTPASSEADRPVPGVQQAETEVLLAYGSEHANPVRDAAPLDAGTQPPFLTEAAALTVAPEPTDTSMRFTQDSQPSAWDGTPVPVDPYATVVADRPTSELRATVSSSPSINIGRPKPPTRLFLLLPLVATGVLMTFAFGFVVWLRSSSEPQPAANLPVPGPSVVQPAESNVSGNTQPSNLPSGEVTNTSLPPSEVANTAQAGQPDRIVSDSLTDRPKSAPTATPKRSPANTAVQRPSPRPEKARQISDDCFYNAKCD